MPEVVLNSPNLHMEPVTITLSQKALLQELPKSRAVSWQDGKVRLHKVTGTNEIYPISREWLEGLMEAYPKVSFTFVDNFVDNPKPNGTEPEAKPKEAAAVPAKEMKPKGWINEMKAEDAKPKSCEVKAQTHNPEPPVPVAKAQKPNGANVEPKAPVSASAPIKTTSIREAALKAITDALTGTVQIVPNATPVLSNLRAATVTADLSRYLSSEVSPQDREIARAELVDAVHAASRIKLLVDAELEHARKVLSTL